MQSPSRVLIYGATYGSLFASKLLLAGHTVRLVCTAAEAESIQNHGTSTAIPIRGSDKSAILESARLPGDLSATTPDQARPGNYDLVVLAMQEPQLRAPEIHDLLARTAAARVPCLSIMNMPPLPFLRRFPQIDSEQCESCYTDPTVWDGFDPDLVTHSSADPQAARSDRPGGHALDVRLATNFRAAAFPNQLLNKLLHELASSIERSRYCLGKDAISVPVRLTVTDSPFRAISKWPMLITGNYRCVMSHGIRSIESAVHDDLRTSRKIYDWVSDVCAALGAPAEDLVPFAKYAAAARSLKAPSSAARALANGVQYIERVDRLVQSVSAQQGMCSTLLEDQLGIVDSALMHNRSATAMSS